MIMTNDKTLSSCALTSEGQPFRKNALLRQNYLMEYEVGMSKYTILFKIVPSEVVNYKIIHRLILGSSFID